jgi:predicted nucleic acid-binding protein
MILVDTSVLVAWLDPDHPHRAAFDAALSCWPIRDQSMVFILALSMNQ